MSTNPPLATGKREKRLALGSRILRWVTRGSFLAFVLAATSLHALGYVGYVSLEWVKRWNPDLQEPGVVFSHFVSYMGYLIRSL